MGITDSFFVCFFHFLPNIIATRRICCAYGLSGKGRKKRVQEIYLLFFLFSLGVLPSLSLLAGFFLYITMFLGFVLKSFL